MAEDSKIQWTDHTFNPWIGCTKVSPGCLHCYAETQNNLRKWNPAGWGKGAPRKRTSEGNWKNPIKWNKAAGMHNATLLGEEHRPRVFCASLADWLDDEVPIQWLADLLALIHATPNLDWLLLTKRPENWKTRLESALAELICRPNNEGMMFAASWLDGKEPANVWVGTTVEDQTRAEERIPHLDAIPARVRFLSCEPLLGPVNLSMRKDWMEMPDGIHWVIAGGESGPGARPMELEWARSLKDQCQAAGVPFFMKQLGGATSHRGEISDFPEDLRIRQSPTTTTP